MDRIGHQKGGKGLKKAYSAPDAEVIAFNVEEDLLNEPIVDVSVPYVDPDSADLGGDF